MAFKMRKATIYKLVDDEKKQAQSREKKQVQSQNENIRVQGEDKINSLDAYYKIEGTEFANESSSDAVAKELAALRKKYPNTSGD